MESAPFFGFLLHFGPARWTVKLLRPVRFSPIWLAFWVAAVNKTRTSTSAEVQGIWAVYDKTLEFFPVEFEVDIYFG